jgi:hypothetical protein
MNLGILDAAPQHIREEVAKYRDETRVATMAVTIASEAIAAALAGEPTGLTEMPKPDAPPAEWHAYFMQRASDRCWKEGVIA